MNPLTDFDEKRLLDNIKHVIVDECNIPLVIDLDVLSSKRLDDKLISTK
jgi:hypothetical protein